jgi:hypothetical protein
MHVKRRANLIWLAVLFGALPAAGAPKGGPSRAPVKGCAWEKLADAKLGLEAWVQRCDFGFRKIDLFFAAGSLAVRYSDGGGPEPLVDVLDLLPDETPEAGVKRLFAARTEKGLVSRCLMAAYRDTKSPPGVKRFTFIPNKSYQKELNAKADPNEVPDPPCGEWGTAPDGIQYFEIQPASGARKVLFVRVGQDEPLFDEKTLRLLPR